MSIFIFPYKAGSKSAVALAQGLEAKIIKKEGSKFVPRKEKVIVNWGSSAMPINYLKDSGRVLNPPEKVVTASNKLSFFKMAKEAGVSIPRFTTNKAEAKSWFDEGVKTIFARLVLNGHSGEGIQKVSSLAELDKIPDGTLLVEYKLKRDEFRIHANAKGVVFAEQQKLRSKEVPEDKIDYQVRNLSNGFIFARNEIKIPKPVLDEAVKAVKASGLDFGAVDVIWNERHKTAYVLEINTAPGLSGTTVVDYVDMFKGEINGPAAAKDLF